MPPPCLPIACPTGPPCNAPGPTNANTGLSAHGVEGLVGGLVIFFMSIVGVYSYFGWFRKPVPPPPRRRQRRRLRRHANVARVIELVARDVEAAAPSTASSSSSSSGSSSDSA
jgi:hypothetical protein